MTDLPTAAGAEATLALAGSSAPAVSAEDDLGARRPVLVVPPELVLDEAAADRLAQQLAVAPSHVLGVVAAVSQIPSGASARTHAEWSAMRPLDEAVETDQLIVDGAVLLRPGVPFVCNPAQVVVGGGPLLVDPGAAAFDPWRDPGPLEPASSDGRPPFPWRPIVLLLGLEPDLDLAERARGLANGLIDHDVEARIAIPDLPEGRHLTRPSQPGPGTVGALEPDVVIALDPTAMASAPAWCGDKRSTVLIELTQDIVHDVSLVSWQIGHAQGRLRARIGRGVSSGELARLVNRLCSGPQPLPPPRGDARPRPDAGAAVGVPRPRPAVPALLSAGAVVAVTGADPTRAPHLQGLAAELDVAGGTIELVTAADLDETAVESAALVVVSSSAGGEVVRRLADVRARVGGALLLDIEPTDVDSTVEVGDDGHPVPLVSLGPELTGMAIAAGLVTTSSRFVAEPVRALGLHAHIVPFVIDRLHLIALDTAAETATPPDAPVVGWNVGFDGPAAAAVSAAVTTALLDLLRDDATACVEVLAAPGTIATELHQHPRASILSAEPEPADLAGWTVQIWTPPPAHAALSGDLRGLIAASLAGVPSLLSAADRAPVAGLVDLGLMVDEAEDATAWSTPLLDLVKGPARPGRSTRARQAATTIYGPAAAALRTSRFLGWMGQVGPR